MKTRLLVPALIVATAIGFFAGVGYSEDPAPDQEEMMKKMMEYATPGAPHKLLESMAGEWDTVMTSTMNPEQPETTKGSAKNTLILGGRYLHQTFSGSWSGMPHEGQGYIGYDNHLKQYQNVWIDNFGTGMVISQGAVIEGGKGFEMRYVWDGPMGKMNGRMLFTISGPDSHKLEGWHTMGDAPEAKSMEIVFTRKK